MDSGQVFELPAPPNEENLQLPEVEDHGQFFPSPQKQQRSQYNPRKRKRRRLPQPPPTSVNSEPNVLPAMFDPQLDSYVDVDSFVANNTRTALQLPGADGAAEQSIKERSHREPLLAFDSEEYIAYVDCVIAGAAGFFQLEPDLFLAQGWDVKKMAVKPGQWYHLQITVEQNQRVDCFCPQFKLVEQCIHVQFLDEHGMQQFPDMKLGTEAKHRDVIIFSWEADDSISKHSFSVASDARRDSVKSRAIVHHIGDEGGSGSWTCSKDSYAKCGHINRARSYLSQSAGSCVEGDVDQGQNGVPEETPELAKSPRGQSCVSHLPILPPSWAALPADAMLYTRPPAVRQPPDLIELDGDAKCLCGSHMNADGVSIRRTCKVYTISEVFDREIELQVCPLACSGSSNRYIGAEGRTQGLFNYNNRVLFSHDLLDDYTMAFTSSETPFVAWVSVLDRRYKTFSPGSAFVSEDLFRNAWFLYTRLQVFKGDMLCPTCGPEPTTVIFDGVTLAYSKKHLTSSLQPPTTIHDNSVTRDCKYVSGQALLKNKDIRKLIRRVVIGRSLILTDSEIKLATDVASTSTVVDSADEEEFEDFSTQSGTAKAKIVREVIDRIEAIPTVRSQLQVVCQDLGDLFGQYCGIERLMAKVITPQIKISAEESALQMIPLPSLDKLNTFIAEPTLANSKLLKCIPALFGIVRYETSLPSNLQQTCPALLLGVCKWLASRSFEVLVALRKHRPPPCISEMADPKSEEDWLKTGSLYSMPKIRHRPRYPNLKYDQRSDGGKQRAKCSKYYAEYGENRLTGGIMVCWCTHNIAYGFHCIPKGEGRNDVFSALLTHWNKPPKWVVYDYACALAPYCMTREADFFKNTRFGIDDCHSSGHTKCSPACFMKTYGDLDPQVDRINTSAAECGNGGIGRIRKSVIYMRQDRAIIYTRVFLAIWNRMKVRRMLEFDG